jgi:hypothetical protein
MSAERREFNLEQAQALGRIEAKIDSLCGPEGRITKLEAQQTRQWWFTACVSPVLFLLQGIARKFGVNV